MKNLGMALLLSIGLVACDKAKYGVTGPTPEVLNEELENTPEVADSEVTAQGFDISGLGSDTCLDQDKTQDAQKLGYELVVVIDKAKNGQTFKVYRKGQLVGDWLTSTGLELKEPRQTTSGRYSTMNTPTGFYTPTKGRLYGGYDKNGKEIIYRSYTWDVPMPNAIFFNGGVAIHETETSNYKYLGSRASGGCVRLHGDVAQDFFNLVKFEAGMGETVALDKKGCVKTDTKGQVVTVEGYRTLIVVRDSSTQN